MSSADHGLTWRRSARCDECGVGHRQACRNDDDDVADNACKGRPWLTSANRDEIAAGIVAAGRQPCTVCRTRSAVAHDVCGRRACRDQHSGREVLK